jgi:hypothetical protein
MELQTICWWWVTRTTQKYHYYGLALFLEQLKQKATKFFRLLQQKIGEAKVT